MNVVATARTTIRDKTMVILIIFMYFFLMTPEKPPVYVWFMLPRHINTPNLRDIWALFLFFRTFSSLAIFFIWVSSYWLASALCLTESQSMSFFMFKTLVYVYYVLLNEIHKLLDSVYWILRIWTHHTTFFFTFEKSTQMHTHSIYLISLRSIRQVNVIVHFNFVESHSIDLSSHFRFHFISTVAQREKKTYKWKPVLLGKRRDSISKKYRQSKKKE